MTAETIHWILEVATAFGVFVLALLATRYLPSYIKEKGKNLATKEDIASITNEIEKVRSQYAENIEALKASLGSRTHMHQVRYEREFEILLGLTEKLVELRDAATTLRPVSEYVNPEETDADRKKRRLTRYQEASRALYLFSESRRPFFPEDIYDALQVVDRKAWSEVVQYNRRSPFGEHADPNYWDNAEKNAAEITSAVDSVLEKIRHRVRLWERFDPGPDGAGSAA